MADVAEKLRDTQSVEEFEDNFTDDNIREVSQEARTADEHGKSLERQREKFNTNAIVIPKRVVSSALADSGGETDSENGYSGVSGNFKIQGGDSSDSGHDSNGLDDDDTGSEDAVGDDVVRQKVSNGAIETDQAQNKAEESKESDVEIIKNAMKNIKLVSTNKNQSQNNSISNNSNLNISKNSSPLGNRSDEHTATPSSSFDAVSITEGRILNSNSSLSNREDGDANSTNRHDDNSKYFTIQDAPRERSCQACPKLSAGCKQGWLLVHNLFPRFRYTGRVIAVAVGSALLLLTVFLLARIPTSSNDVSQPAMYDLPDDDAFRPAGQLIRRPDDESSGLQHLPGRLMAPPGSEAHLRELARRHGVALHPELGVPVDEEYIRLEKDRKFKLAQMRAAAKKKDMKEVLDMVKETIEDERSQMKDKEKFWSKDVTPLRILLVSTWRSGSTFLGQAILQHPGVFEHYEPFSYAGIRQIRSGAEAFQSQQFLHRLLECRFSGQDMYLNYTRQYPQDMIGHNKRIWGPCSKTRRIDLCSNATFLTEACNMFPIQLVKSVRLRLNLTQLFLGETRLNAKVIFLIRDPRATMNSRRSSVSWCEDSSDCSSPDVLCSDLREDLKVAAALERLYPNSFTMLRYEDLANDPQNELKKLFDFLGMYYSKAMADFVSKHTESEVEKPWSIARKSAARVSRWKEKMKPQEIQEIENACKAVIEKLNYELVGQK